MASEDNVNPAPPSESIIEKVISILLALVVAGYGIALLVNFSGEVVPIIGALLLFITGVILAIPTSKGNSNNWIRIIISISPSILIVGSIIAVIISLISLFGNIGSTVLREFPYTIDYRVIINEYIWWWLGAFLGLLSAVFMVIKILRARRK